MPISGGGGTGSSGGGGVSSDVDVLSVIPGTSATRLGKAEDAAHTTGDVGVMSLAVRKDTGAALAGADGDYAPLQVDADGALRVTGGAGGGGDASAANQTTIIGHLDGVEGILGTIDADTSALAGAVSGTEVQVDVVTSALPSGAATAANQTTVIGHLDGVETLLGTGATGLGKVEDSAHANGDVGIMVLGVRNDSATSRSGTDGDYVGLATDSAGRVGICDLGGSVTVDGTVATTQSGTWNVGSITTLPSLPAGTNNIGDVDIASGTVTTVTTLTGGGVAHDAADSGNPHKVGGRARTSDVTAVTNDDRIDQIHDALGAQVMRPYSLHENLVSGATAAITGTTSTSVLPSAGAGVRNYVTSLLVTNSHATVGTLVTITDGSGGTTLYAGYAAPEGGGFALSFPTPLRGSAATAVHAVNGTTGSNVYVSASGYKAAV